MLCRFACPSGPSISTRNQASLHQAQESVITRLPKALKHHFSQGCVDTCTRYTTYGVPEASLLGMQAQELLTTLQSVFSLRFLADRNPNARKEESSSVYLFYMLASRFLLKVKHAGPTAQICCYSLHNSTTYHSKLRSFEFTMVLLQR